MPDGTVQRATFAEIQRSRNEAIFQDGVGAEWAPTKYGEYYATSPFAYRAVKLRADAVASAPLKVFQTTGDVPEQVAPDHPLQVLLDRVNPWWTSADLWKATETYLSLWGSAFWWLERRGMNGPVTSIWPLRPDRTTIVPGGGSDAPNVYIRGYYYQMQGKRIPLSTSEVVWFRYFNPLDEYAGMSPIASARASLDMGRHSVRFNKSFFENNAMPQDLVFTVQGPLSDDEVKEFYERLERRYRGPDNAHRPMLVDLSHGSEPKRLGLSQKDMEFVAGLNFTLQEASRVWGVPPPKLYSQEASIYNNVKQADIEFYTDTVSAEWRFLETEVNELLLPNMGSEASSLFVRFDTSGILPLQEALGELHDRERQDVTAGVLTINEVRAKRGLEPVSWGDTWWLQATQMPAELGALGGVGEPTENMVVDALTTKPHGYRRLSSTTKGYSGTQIERILDKHVRALDREQRSFRAMQRSLFGVQLEDVKKRLGALDTKALTDYVKQTEGASLFNARQWDAIFARVGRPVVLAILRGAAREDARDFNLGPFDANSTTIQTWIDARLGIWAGRANDETARLLLQEIEAGLNNAESIRQLQERVERVFAFNDLVRSERIARTESLAATSQGHMEIYEQSGEVEAKTWISTLDERVREAHLDAHLQTVLLHEPFIVGGEELKAPGLGGSAANVINCRCLPGDSLVAAKGIRRAYRRWYEGELIEITTASGYQLAGTPNHPVLTDRGWVALGSISKGDYVINGIAGQGMAGRHPNVDDIPTPISQIYDAMALSGLRERIGGAPMQFHGDGRQGEVHIVTSYDALPNGRQPTFSEQGKQGGFSLSHRQMSMSCDNTPGLIVREALPIGITATPFLDASSPQTGADNISMVAIGSRQTQFGFSLQIALDDSVNRQAELGSPSSSHLGDRQGIAGRLISKQTSRLQDGLESDGPDMEPMAEALGTFPSDICRDRILNISRRRFSGHVYNLETETGWYISNGIITHNCRVVPILHPRKLYLPERQPKELPIYGLTATDSS